MDRFIAVIFPSYYCAYVTANRIILLSGVTWILAAIAGSGEIFVELNAYDYYRISLTHYIFARAIPNLIVYVVLVLLMFFIHGKLAFVANRQRRQIASLDERPKEKSHGFDRATEMMSIIVAVYIFLWTPYTITSVIAICTGSYNSHLIVFAALCGAFNSSINCIIYFNFNSKLKRAFKTIFLGNMTLTTPI